MSGKRVKAERKKEREGLIDQMILGHDLEQLDVWTDPESGEIFFAPKEAEVPESSKIFFAPAGSPPPYPIFPQASEPEKEYPDDPRPICTGCGKRQNETHYVPLMKSGGGGFFTCDDAIETIEVIT